MKSISFLCLLFSIIYAQSSADAVKYLGAGVVIGGVAGIAKEAFCDKPRGNEWEAKDVLYTTLGGVLSGMAVDILTSNSRIRSGNGKK